MGARSDGRTVASALPKPTELQAVGVDLSFHGKSNVRIDAKSRLSVPAGFRRQLEDGGDARVVLAPALFDATVHYFPWAAWKAREALIASLPQSDARVIAVKKLQFSLAVDVTPDGHGRVLLPADLRQHAGIELESDVVVVGQGQTFDLWSATAWQQSYEEARASLAGLRDSLAAVGL